MLCIFAGPTKLLDLNRRLVVINSHPDIRAKDDLGNKPLFQDAGMLQRAIESELGPCEHSPVVQYRREGKYLYDLYTETREKRYYRRMAQNGFEPKVARYALPYNLHKDPFFDEPLATTTYGGQWDTKPMQVHISTSLYDAAHDYIRVDWWPEGWSFGNGVTTNVWVLLRSRLQLVSWCVLAPQTAARMGEDKAAWALLKRIMEA